MVSLLALCHPGWDQLGCATSAIGPGRNGRRTVLQDEALYFLYEGKMRAPKLWFAHGKKELEP